MMVNTARDPALKWIENSRTRTRTGDKPETKAQKPHSQLPHPEKPRIIHTDQTKYICGGHPNPTLIQLRWGHRQCQVP